MGAEKAVLRVPVIDVAVLMACESDAAVQAVADSGALDQTIDELRAATAEWGFFYIMNHGVSEPEIEDFRATMRAFFALPKETKYTVRRTEGNPHGYFDGELTKNKPDWKEIFDFTSRGTAPGEARYQAQPELRNQWLPDETLPGFRTKMVDHFLKVQQLSRRVVMLFSLALGKHALFLDRFYRDDKGELADSDVMRLNYYPVSPEPEKTMGVYHHTDAGALAVLLQDDDVASLQVFHRGAKQWVFVPPRKGTYVINIGDMLQIWSNDRFHAPLHRVLSSGSAARYSAPFFSHPALSAMVEPILMGDEERPRYKPVNWLDFILKRAQGNYADLGEEVQIDQYRI